MGLAKFNLVTWIQCIPKTKPEDFFFHVGNQIETYNTQAGEFISYINIFLILPNFRLILFDHTT